MKNFFNQKLVKSIANEVWRAYPQFDRQQFFKQASNNLHKLELKARSAQIAHALAAHLPEDFENSTALLLSAMGTPDDSDDAEGMEGFRYLPYLDFIEHYGIEDPEVSVKALEQMTQFFSAEFAIRPFIKHSPILTMKAINRWSGHSDWRVRRLASEGTRPRLPWGKQLTEFIKDPAPVLKILERLHDDENLVVRRSVANNLNDIAKDHPDLAAEVAARWMKSKSTDAHWTAKHGLRTLVKQGHPQALLALGFTGGEHIEVKKLILNPATLDIGGRLNITFTLFSREHTAVTLVVDYALNRVLANGASARKVFKIGNRRIEPHNSFEFKKHMDFLQRTTRTYYPGHHSIDILVNGQIKATKSFVLKKCPHE